MVLLATAPPAPTVTPAAIAAEQVRNLRSNVMAAQKRLKLSTTALSVRVGVPASTMSGVVQGKTPSQYTILCCLDWLAKQ